MSEDKDRVSDYCTMSSSQKVMVDAMPKDTRCYECFEKFQWYKMLMIATPQGADERYNCQPCYDTTDAREAAKRRVLDRTCHGCKAAISLSDGHQVKLREHWQFMCNACKGKHDMKGLIWNGVKGVALLVMIGLFAKACVDDMAYRKTIPAPMTDSERLDRIIDILESGR